MSPCAKFFAHNKYNMPLANVKVNEKKSSKKTNDKKKLSWKKFCVYAKK